MRETQGIKNLDGYGGTPEIQDVNGGNHLPPGLLTENRLATYREASEYLRYSEVYLRRLVKEGKIPYIKRGRSIRFRIAALDKWNLESEVSIGTAKAKR